MANPTREGDDLEGVEFVREDDGSITARDLETGLARRGDTRAEALAGLAQALELHEGGGGPTEDSDEFLAEELDIYPDEPDGDRESSGSRR